MARRVTRRGGRLEPPAELSEEQQKMLLAIDIMRVIFEQNLSDAEAAAIAAAEVADVEAIRSLEFDQVELSRLVEMASRLSPTE